MIDKQERTLGKLFASEEFVIGFGFGATTVAILMAIMLLGW